MQRVRFSGRDVVLDLGCGLGIQTLCIGRKCRHITGVDPDQIAIAFAKTVSSYVRDKIPSSFLCGRLEEQGLPSNSFDKVFSICVLEHVPNCVDVVREVYRILRNRGEFIFSVDSLANITDRGLVQKHRIANRVFRYFDTDDLRHVLECSGFKNIAINPILGSDFARSLFAKRISSGRWASRGFLLEYALLRIREMSSKKQDGIILIGKCQKRSPRVPSRGDHGE